MSNLMPGGSIKHPWRRPMDPNPFAGDLPLATGVTAGAPGSFTPATAKPPNLAELQRRGALGQTTKWSVGQFVALGDTSEAHWSGTAWAAGRAAAAQRKAT